MLEQFQLHLENSFPFIRGKKILLAVSGGIDSMILLELFQKTGTEITVLHYNFQLRAQESDEDELFIVQYCKNNAIQFFSKKTATKEYASEQKLSIQLAARKLRYEWFYEQLSSLNYDYIATAHHLDDSLETFIINFTRGTGLDGLVGIPTVNNKVIRPLLPFSRSQIEHFAAQNNIRWREDASNITTKYLRNKLRHDVIPVLKEIQPDLLSNFKQTVQHLQDSQSIILDAIQHFKNQVMIEKDGIFYFDCDKMMAFSNYRNYLYQILSSFGFSAWDDIYVMVEKQSGKQIFSENYILLKDRNALILYSKTDSQNETYLIDSKNKIVKFPLNLSFSNTNTISNPLPNCIFVDEDTLQFPLQIRKWTEGDTFYPFGMIGKKKISKYFKDKKMSLIQKENTWILCSNNQIVWVIGMRMDDRFKVTNETRNILKITLDK